ncbi:MAG: hypothetical protein KatS3mg115_0509 [Candidatus Poribacteria bacterium]|nr:MAG: hypothetical protein KatS3mg115_0509 [Candidatus Poribacteria bacterium]
MGSGVGALSGGIIFGLWGGLLWLFLGGAAGYGIGYTGPDLAGALSFTTGLLVGGLIGGNLFPAWVGWDDPFARWWGSALVGLFTGALVGTLLRVFGPWKGISRRVFR